MHPFLISLLRLLYPLKACSHTRDRPLSVLALGLSRSGTESLRQALYELGYNDVHHGFRFILESSEAIPWLYLAHAQQTSNQSSLRAKDFDKVLGDCMAVTDIPSATFAAELVDAYPDAKVILNYREDVEAWYQSVLATLETYNESWYDWVLTFFQREMFWHQRTFNQLWRRQFDWDFRRNGKKVYFERYERLEAKLPKERYLKWKVEDGWEPLCEFLGKKVPSKPFPSGNTPRDYEAKMGNLYLDRRKEAERNLRLASASSVAIIAGAIWYYYGS